MLSEYGRTINVGLIGFGNVGKGVVRYFSEGGGDPFNVHLKRVAVADLSKPRDPQFSAITDKPMDIYNDRAIDIVVELIGGVDPAKNFILEALYRRKSVVTANKAVMSSYAKELFDAARSRSVDLGFEASVAGGIPIIRILRNLQGEEINQISGIINGTTNYMLTRMEEGMDFDTALRIAQEKGFAEADHMLDTGGFDTRDKLAILASLAFDTPIDSSKIAVQGILGVNPVDIDFAAKLGIDEGGRGYSVKLLAQATRYGDALDLSIAPTLVSRDKPLASVRNEVNAVYINAELAGEQVFIGKGAGTNSTTSAVISDVLRIADNIRRGTPDKLPFLNSQLDYVDPDSVVRRGYLRVNLLDQPGSGAEVLTTIARHGLNVKDSLQRSRFGFGVDDQRFVPDIITLDHALSKNIRAALEELEWSTRVHGKPFFLSFHEEPVKRNYAN